MNTKLKCRVTAETLTDGSIVFNVMRGHDVVAAPPTLEAAQKICDQMNIGFTPGPWSVFGDNQIEGMGTIIAETVKCSIRPREIDCANARLMAKAPELLAKLRKLAGIAEGIVSDWASLVADTDLPEKERVTRQSFYHNELAKYLDALGEATEEAFDIIKEASNEV